VSKDFRGRDQAKDYALRDAEAIISAAVRHFKMEGGERADFAALPRGDVRRAAGGSGSGSGSGSGMGFVAKNLGSTVMDGGPAFTANGRQRFGAGAALRCEV
jgi:hypothetical protein